MDNDQTYVSKKGVHVPKDIKEYILKRAKESGKSVPEIAKEHGIGKTAIYNWRRDETAGSSDPQLLRLSKEYSGLGFSDRYTREDSLVRN